MNWHLRLPLIKLNMRSGIRIINEKGEEFEKYRDQLKGQNLVQAIFEQSNPITPESQSSFSYGNYSTPLVMQVIDAGGKDVSNQGYGYFWWSGDLKYGDKNYFSASAQGGSGQFIILIKELDLIVVATGSHRGSSGKNLQIAAERILPAFIH